MLLGGAFKRKEKMSGRFADALAYMFYTSAVLRKFEIDGQPRSDLPLVEWSAKYGLYQVQMALDEILRNFPLKWLGVVLRYIVFPLGHSLRLPNDYLSHRVAALMIKPGDARDRLTAGIQHSDDPEDITGCLDDALNKVLLAEPIERRLRHEQLIQPDNQPYLQWLEHLAKDGHIDATELDRLTLARLAIEKVIAVDDFDSSELALGSPSLTKPAKKKAASRTKTTRKSVKKAATKKTSGSSARKKAN